MKFNNCIAVVVAVATLLPASWSCTSRQGGAASCIKIVPEPVSVEYVGEGLAVRTVRVAPAAGFCEVLNPLVSTFLEVAEGDGVDYKASRIGRADVVLSVDPELEEEEYTLNSAGEAVVITGGSAKGVWWGLQTLRQIMVQCPVVGSRRFIPGMVISDKPQFAYRGAHLDVCRHFFGVEDVKTFIDMMVMHKLNTFHWHLTDNEGWRIEIKRYPLLTEIGSIRKETVIGHYYVSHKFDGTPYGGFYTQDQIREIVAYAAARQIEIIPEIETPGHSLAALASYQYLGCKGSGYEVGRGLGSTPNVFCPGKESTFEFVEGVIDELCELFPSEYIHIGGDEVRKNEWQVCPNCQARIASEHLDGVVGLQAYFIARVEKYVLSKGKKIIGWDEILDGGVSKTALVMSWRGTEGGIKAAKLGNDVIMTPSSYFYFDYAQYPDFSDILDHCNADYREYLPLEKSYSFNPYEGLTPDEAKHIIGVQGNTWTELMPDMARVQTLTLPRFAALADCSWCAPDAKTTYPEFLGRVNAALVPLYTAHGYTYATRDIESVKE